MNKLKAWLGGLMAAVVGMVGNVAQAAPDYASLESEITSGATAATAVVTTAIIAGFGIFVLIWGARKIKGALSSGS